MLALRIVDQANRWLSHAGQSSNLIGMVHAQLNDRAAMDRPQAQQGQRNTDLVVQVSLGGQTTCIPLPSGENGGNHFLGCRLAVAACNGHDRQAETLTPCLTQFHQGKSGIAQCNLWQPGFRTLFLDKSRQGTCLKRLIQEIMRIEFFAAQSNKNRARVQLAGIGLNGMLLSQHHGSPGPLPIIEGFAHPLDFLIGFVSLASQHDQIYRLGTQHSAHHSQRTIRLDHYISV